MVRLASLQSVIVVHISIDHTRLLLTNHSGKQIHVLTNKCVIIQHYNASKDEKLEINCTSASSILCLRNETDK